MLAILAYALAWLFISTIVALTLGVAIAHADRRPQRFEGSGDARGGGVDQVSHHFGDM